MNLGLRWCFEHDFVVPIDIFSDGKVRQLLLRLDWHFPPSNILMEYISSLTQQRRLYWLRRSSHGTKAKLLEWSLLLLRRQGPADSPCKEKVALRHQWRHHAEHLALRSSDVKNGPECKMQLLEEKKGTKYVPNGITWNHSLKNKACGHSALYSSGPTLPHCHYIRNVSLH